MGMANPIAAQANSSLPNIASGGLGNAANPYALGQVGEAMSSLQTATPMASSTSVDTPMATTAAPTTTAATTTTATPVTTLSDPNTATLGTGQTSNPFNAATNPYIQAAQATTLGNLAGAQSATAANRINQNTPYASLNYTQTLDANGNPVWTANQQLAQPLQSALGNIQGQLAQATATPFDASQYQAQTGQGFTGMEGWDRATQLINQRLQPQIQQSNDRLTAQLANQGIVPGTEAYNRAMTQQAQKTNDLLNQAQLAGSQVQNQMQGQSLAQQQANNAALLQNYTQAMQQRNLPLSQLGAFQQATTPGYINPYTQAAVAGPDYLGAYTTSRAADIAAQNAQAAKTANLQNGLFGLGSSAILGAGGIANLGSSILGGATTLGGLLGLGGTPGLGQTTNWLGQVVSDPTYGAGDIYNNMTPDELTNMFEWGI